MLEVQGVSLLYEDHGKEVAACRDISLRVSNGEFLGILGPSGSGKSSLLYLLSGLKQPTRGRALFEGTDLHALPEPKLAELRRRSFGFVFQQPFLLGYLSALENVISAVPSDAKGMGERARELLEALGLKDKMGRRPAELSGGERQRVCVARALVHSPQVVFADEPTAALDHKNGEAVVEMMSRFRGQGALVMVTHDPSMLGGADRIVHLADGELQNVI